jgi:hypothetical protein
MKNSRLNLVKLQMTAYQNREAEQIFMLPLYLNVDPLWDFPYVTNQFVSSRHTDSYIYVTDNTHPTPSGHYKMADVIYYVMKYAVSLE